MMGGERRVLALDLESVGPGARREAEGMPCRKAQECRASAVPGRECGGGGAGDHWQAPLGWLCFRHDASRPAARPPPQRGTRPVSSSSLSITDNRTGQSYEVPINDGTIRATDLRQIKTDADDFGLMTYDPAFMNTASCRSAITYIDGDKGILRYRGYPIEQLAERANFLEVAYLLFEGELPNQAQLAKWTDEVRYHTYVHTNITKFLESFRYDAHPMGMLLGSVGALSTFYPDAKNIHDPANRYLQRIRLLAKLPTIAAFIFRHSRGLPYEFPRNDLDYIGNFVNMTFSIGGKHEPNPVLQRALEILFILHADHEQNCSTSAVRAVGSSHVDPFSAVSAGIAALYGPLHGGANEAVLTMLDEIGDKSHIPAFIAAVKGGSDRLMGFGHRVYKSYDPRAKLVKKVAYDVFEQTGLNPKLEIALELEKIALEDEYFVKRKLYPNVDFYSGLIYQAMGYPTDFFTVLFALGRAPGWLAHWQEMLMDKEQKIARPRQIFTGYGERNFIPIGSR
jgi:citrate synthase